MKSRLSLSICLAALLAGLPAFAQSPSTPSGAGSTPARPSVPTPPPPPPPPAPPPVPQMPAPETQIRRDTSQQDSDRARQNESRDEQRRSDEQRRNEERAAMFDAHLAGMKAGLRLTEDQQRMWPAVESALRDYAAYRRDLRDGDDDDDDDNNDTIFDELRERGEQAQRRGDVLVKLADALEPFEASLSDEQRSRMQRLLAPIHRRLFSGGMDDRGGMRGKWPGKGYGMSSHHRMMHDWHDGRGMRGHHGWHHRWNDDDDRRGGRDGGWRGMRERDDRRGHHDWDDDRSDDGRRGSGSNSRGWDDDDDDDRGADNNRWR